MKACDQLIDHLIRHIDGSLSNSEAASFHNHLQGCPACRVRHRELRRMVRPKSGAECQTCDGFLAAGSGGGGSGPGGMKLPLPRRERVNTITDPASRDGV